MTTISCLHCKGPAGAIMDRSTGELFALTFDLNSTPVGVCDKCFYDRVGASIAAIVANVKRGSK